MSYQLAPPTISLGVSLSSSLTHRNLEPEPVEHIDTDKSHEKGSHKETHREPVHTANWHIVVAGCEVRDGCKGQPHLQESTNSSLIIIWSAVVDKIRS